MLFRSDCFRKRHMAVKPTHEDGHLVVAAVRVLSHRSSKPPTPEEIANLLGLAPEFVRSLVVALGDQGILRVIENPFEIRAEVGNYAGLEDLPRGSGAPSIKDELEGFLDRKRKAAEETEKMLSMDGIEKKEKEKLSRLEEEMKKMKGKLQFPGSEPEN
jgi:hypothetical protein